MLLWPPFLRIMALKQDEDFLRFLTMGAAGTAAILDVLNIRHGHRMVELERYSTANKIWLTKLKRLRLPDLLCLDCGIRVEVRAKSTLAIRMSHSASPGREWDAGLRDRDVAAFIAWRHEPEAPSEHHQFFQIGGMRSAIQYAKLGARKAPSEGAERDITWPARVPKRNGRVVEIDSARGTVRYRPAEGRLCSYSLRGAAPAYIYVKAKQTLVGGEQFVLGCVPTMDNMRCPGQTWDLIHDLNSDDTTDRYAAVKAAAAGHTNQALEHRLLEIAEDAEEDERIRLEARGSLASIDPERHIDELICYAHRPGSSKSEKAFAMESIFILSELRSSEAVNALAALARDTAADSEARCAAVWGLGIAGADDARQVLPFIADPDDEVALHAMASVGELDIEALGTLRRMLESGDDRRAASAAALLVDEGEDGISHLLEVAQHRDQSGLWSRAALGEIPEADLRETADKKLSPGLESALSAIWISQRSWLKQQAVENPLDFLRRQCIRHLG